LLYHHSHCLCYAAEITPATSRFFFFTDTPTTNIYTLSLHDALPISHGRRWDAEGHVAGDLEGSERRSQPVLTATGTRPTSASEPDRKSTRLNSSHVAISYAVFCLKKKNKSAATSP